MTTQPKKDVYGIVTDHIINCMETGVIPWRVSWAAPGIPTNLITQKPYRGINVPLLAMYPFESNYFLTDDQLKNIGGTVKEGQYPVIATHWEWVDGKEDNKKLPLLKYHKVYNLDQCEGIAAPAPHGEKKEKPLAVCKKIVRGMHKSPNMVFNEPSAFYFPDADSIHMPSADDYKYGEGYYFDLFRMLIHSTGHSLRLDRKELLEQEPLFSREELIADIGAHYLCYHAGIISISVHNTLSVIHGWLAKFHDDPRLIVFAATQAQKTVDYILNFKGEAADANETPSDDGQDGLAE